MLRAAASARCETGPNTTWTQPPDEIRALVERYLARDYRNPLVEAEAPGTRFEMLKCLDLYHSNDLNMTTRRLVINPKRTSRTAPR